MNQSLFVLLMLSMSTFVVADDKTDNAPSHENVSYGPHKSNVLDIWIAKGNGPRPLHVYIHGGGWIGGDKSRKGEPQNLWRSKGISYAAINYRHTLQASLPAPVHDAARAIQFLRSKAKEWNIDKNRICLSGGSAGACTSMWLLCHNDLADPLAEDPVLQESTRVSGAAISGGQTSIDPKQIKSWLGPMVLQHRMINMAVGEPTIEGALKNYAKHKPLYVEFSAYNHVSKDDPPLFMKYGGDMTLPSKSAGHGIHHPVYGVKMKEKADRVGMECHLLIGDGSVSKSANYQNANEFIETILLVQPK
jgi:arylformamidase